MYSVTRYFALCFFIFLLGTSLAFSQGSTADQIEDYVILKNGRRYDGTVLRKLGQLDFEKIEFLRRGETEVYSPEDIQSFGLGTGEFFKSVVLPLQADKQFIQVFYEGELLLGRGKDAFYAGKEDDLRLLSAKSESGIKEDDKSYKDILLELMKGACQKRVSSLIRGSKLNEDDLVWLFTKFYECKAGDFTFYGKARPAYILSPIGRLGVLESGIKTHIKSGDRKDLLTSTPIIQGYVGYSIHSLRKYPRFFADAGLAFETSKLTWESQYFTSSIKVTGTEEIAHSFVSIPLTINYSIFKTRKNDFFVGIGGGYGVSLSDSKFAIQEERVVFSDRVQLQEGSFNAIKGGGFFYHAQAGLLVNLPAEKALTFSAIFRHLSDYYSVKAGTNTANYHKLDLGFAVGFRF